MNIDNIILVLFSIFGLTFFVKETDGPWGIMGWIRNKLITNSYIGSFFYKLLDCWFCTGCWSGGAIYFLTQENYKLNFLGVWWLAGGTISLILGSLWERLIR